MNDLKNADAAAKAHRRAVKQSKFDVERPRTRNGPVGPPWPRQPQRDDDFGDDVDTLMSATASEILRKSDFNQEN